MQTLSSESAYVRARAEGESKVREVFNGATILRPSVLFGPGDAFFNTLASITRLSPVVPLFGNGEVRLQPVFVGDVAEAVVKALSEPAAKGNLYELGGPRVYTYRALVELLLRPSAAEAARGACALLCMEGAGSLAWSAAQPAADL